MPSLLQPLTVLLLCVGFASAAETTATWPTDLHAVIFRTTGDARRPYQVYDASGTLVPRTMSAFGSNGFALVSHHGILRCLGGGFACPKAGALFVPAIQSSGAWTIEVALLPSLSGAPSAGTILAVQGTDGQANGALTLTKERLCWTTRGSSDGCDLGNLPANGVHLVIVGDAHGVTWFRDGLPATVTPAPAADLAHWTAGRLTIGGDGGPSWQGEIHALALYARTLGASEIAANATALRARQAARTVPRVVVTARAVQTTPPAAMDENAYRMAYAVHEYEIVAVHAGTLAERRIRVAQWQWVDRTVVTTATPVNGQEYRLELEAVSAHDELENEQGFDALDPSDEPFFLDVGPLLAAQPTTAAP